jgi:hypothetical protein
VTKETLKSGQTIYVGTCLPFWEKLTCPHCIMKQYPHKIKTLGLKIIPTDKLGRLKAKHKGKVLVQQAKAQWLATEASTNIITGMEASSNIIMQLSQVDEPPNTQLAQSEADDY